MTSPTQNRKIPAQITKNGAIIAQWMMSSKKLQIMCLLLGSLNFNSSGSFESNGVLERKMCLGLKIQRTKSILLRCIQSLPIPHTPFIQHIKPKPPKNKMSPISISLSAIAIFPLLFKFRNLARRICSRRLLIEILILRDCTLCRLCNLAIF